MNDASWKWIAGAFIFVVPIACQREIVAVDNGSSAAGGSASSAFASTFASTKAVTATAGAGLGCGSPEPEPPITDLGTSDSGGSTGTVSTTGTGTDAQCDHVIGDAAGHTWDSDCVAGGCDCILDSAVACTCTFQPGEDCLQSGTCCPAPWTPP